MNQEYSSDWIRLEVADMLEHAGYNRKTAIEAVDRVMFPGELVADAFLDARAWLDDDWERLSVLYMTTAINWIRYKNYLIDEFRFSNSPKYVGYIMSVKRDDILYGCVMWGVKRTKEGFMGSYGITPPTICEIL